MASQVDACALALSRVVLLLTLGVTMIVRKRWPGHEALLGFSEYG
jgi:hypothetical protein